MLLSHDAMQVHLHDIACIFRLRISRVILRPPLNSIDNLCDISVVRDYFKRRIHGKCNRNDRKCLIYFQVNVYYRVQSPTYKILIAQINYVYKYYTI